MQINHHEEEMDKCLFDALYALMQTNPIEEISVGDILAKAHVSRSSFYRRYRDKYELLTRSYERLLSNTYLLCLQGSSWKESAVSLYRVLEAHPLFFKHALASQGPNSLRQYITDISMECFEEIFRQHGEELQSDWRMVTAARCYVQGTCAVTCEWAANDMPYTAEALIGLFYEILPDMLKPYCM